MKAREDFITWLLTVPRGRIFLCVSSKFGVNNKLRTNKPNLNHILQERGGRLTCREDKRCVESLLSLSNKFHVQTLGPHLKSHFCPAAYFELHSKRAWEAISFGGMKASKHSRAGPRTLLLHLPLSLSKASFCTKQLAVHKVTNKHPSITWSK